MRDFQELRSLKAQLTPLRGCGFLEAAPPCIRPVCTRGGHPGKGAACGGPGWRGVPSQESGLRARNLTPLRRFLAGQ